MRQKRTTVLAAVERVWHLTKGLMSGCVTREIMFIIIDGDDVGRKITSCYLSNDEARLGQISHIMTTTVTQIAQILRQNGFRVIFCAADGVVATSEAAADALSIFDSVRRVAPTGFTFSAGAGGTLQQAYLALMHAKCSGKNTLSDYSLINRSSP